MSAPTVSAAAASGHLMSKSTHAPTAFVGFWLAFSHGDFYSFGLAAAQYLHWGWAADDISGEVRHEFLMVSDGLVVDADDNIADDHARVPGGAVVFKANNKQTGFVF